jgi:hypothetical protein
MKSLKWTERLLLDLAEIGLLGVLLQNGSSNSDNKILKLCLYVALVMKLLKLLAGSAGFVR